MAESISPAHVVLRGRDNASTMLSVGGMTCGSCSNSVHRALLVVPGVVDVEVDFKAGHAVVHGAARSEDLRAAIEQAGYTVGRLHDSAPRAGRKAGGCGCGC